MKLEASVVLWVPLRLRSDLAIAEYSTSLHSNTPGSDYFLGSVKYRLDGRRRSASVLIINKHSDPLETMHVNGVLLTQSAFKLILYLRIASSHQTFVLVEVDLNILSNKCCSVQSGLSVRGSHKWFEPAVFYLLMTS